MLFTKEMAPVITRGRSAVTVPMVAIAEAGQGRFNSHATKALLAGTKLQPSEVKEIFVDFDEKTRKMSFTLDHTKIKGAKVGSGISASIGAKSGQLAFTISWIANQLGYNFKESGNHTFALDSKADSHVYTFAFPSGVLPNTTVKRTRKAKGEAPKSESESAPVTEDIE